MCLHIHIAAWNGKSPKLNVKNGSTTIASNISLTSDANVSGSSTTYNLATQANANTNYYKVVTLTTALESQTTLTIESSGERSAVWGVNAEALPTGVTIMNGNTAIDELNMTVGDDDVTLNATVAPTNAFQGVTWTSNTPGVATVTNGVVHAVAAGSATITATSTADNTKYAECTVTVTAASSPTATVSVTELDFGEVAVGGTKQMTFTVTPANLEGNLTIASNNAKYTVSPTSIAQDATGAQTITVTAAPTAANDDMDGQITISGGGIANKAVTLSTTLYEVANVTLIATDDNGSFKQGDNAVTSITSRVGSSATVTAVPNDGYLFDSWTATGATPASSTTPTTEFTFTSTTPTLTANFIVDPRMFATLEGTDMESMSSAGTGYGTLKSIIKDGLLWETTGYQTSELKSMIQLRSSGTPYIKLPDLSGNIYSITFSVTNSSATSKGGTKTDGTLNFRTTASGSNIATGGGSSTNEITIDLSGIATKYNTGYITLSGTATRIWDITVAYIPTDINVTIPASKYTTFSDHLARDFSGTAVKAYKAKVDGDKVALTEISNGKVPANTGVILYGDAGDYSIPVTTSSSAVTENELIGVTVRTLVEWETGGDGKKNYILQGGVFKKAADGGHLKANRAYLHTSYDVTAAGARDYLEFAFEDGDVTAIETVKGEKADGQYYNLNGQKVKNPTKGLYIINGKKVVIK